MLCVLQNNYLQIIKILIGSKKFSFTYSPPLKLYLKIFYMKSVLVRQNGTQLKIFVLLSSSAVGEAKQ